MNTPTTPTPARPAAQTLPITDFPELATKAAELLRAYSPNFKLTPEEAASIAALMRMVNYPAGAAVFRAGEAVNTSYMLLILEGDISVDTGNVNRENVGRIQNRRIFAENDSAKNTGGARAACGQWFAVARGA